MSDPVMNEQIDRAVERTREAMKGIPPWLNHWRVYTRLLEFYLGREEVGPC